MATTPTLTAGAVNALPGQTGVTLLLTGTGLFDPGASFVQRPTATLSGTGISNVNVNVLSATSAAVTFDVASTAPAGARSVTLTAPDGQSVLRSNAVTVLTARPLLVVTRTIAKVGANYELTVTVTNKGGLAANNVRLTAATLGVAATSTGLPISLGTLAAGGGAAVRTLVFPGSAGASGARVTSVVKGDYTGSTFNNTSSIVLP